MYRNPVSRKGYLDLYGEQDSQWHRKYVVGDHLQLVSLQHLSIVHQSVYVCGEWGSRNIRKCLVGHFTSLFSGGETTVCTNVQQ